MDWLSWFNTPTKSTTLDQAADAILKTPLPPGLTKSAQTEALQTRALAADLIRSGSDQARLAAAQLLIHCSDSLAVIEQLCL